jgi:hypothetical protein
MSHKSLLSLSQKTFEEIVKPQLSLNNLRSHHKETKSRLMTVIDLQSVKMKIVARKAITSVAKYSVLKQALYARYKNIVKRTRKSKVIKT